MGAFLVLFPSDASLILSPLPPPPPSPNYQLRDSSLII